MKKILIVGASSLQIPAIIKAKSLGYFVGVVDYNPEAPGIKYADEYFNASTIDIQKVVEIANKFSTDGIMTLATDMPIRSVAAVCAELGLAGISLRTAINATDKGEMMEVFKANSVPHPWFHILSSEDELSLLNNNIIYPCIIKPTDSSGSKGVILVNNEYEMYASYKYSRKHSRNGKVIIQEYLEGNEVSVEVMIDNGKPHVLAVTDKITSGAPHFVETGHSQPSKLNNDNIEKIKKLAIDAIRAIGINIGAAHVEIMFTNKGPMMIELGARMGGDYITTDLVPLSTGIDMVEAVIQQACDESYEMVPEYSKGSIIKYFNTSSGIIKKINGIGEAKRISGVKKIIIMKKIGDIVGDINSSNDRIGLVIAQGDDVYLAEKACDQAIKCIKVITK